MVKILNMLNLFNQCMHSITFLETSASAILVHLGEELISTCCTGIVERAFQCLGGDLQEFLSSLDGVYDVLKLKDEDDTDTGFVCAGEGELIFTSERPVIAWLLLGSMKALTKMLYDVDVSIVIEPVEGDPRRYRYLFTQPAADEIKRELVEGLEDVAEEVATAKPDLKMNPATFCKAFPWHFVMNENLELVQIGKNFKPVICLQINIDCFIYSRNGIQQVVQEQSGGTWSTGHYVL